MRPGVYSLTLQNFRSYESFSIEPMGENVIFFGENGAGKTNLLEALSLFAPGRGLRRARLADMLHHKGHAPKWQLDISLFNGHGLINLSTTGHISPQKERRTCESFGKSEKTLNALAKYTALGWITPQMDRLFFEGASVRRRFIDQLGTALFTGYADMLSQYDNLVEEWSKVRSGPFEPQWLKAIEVQVATLGLNLTEKRLQLSYLLNDKIGQRASNFPKAQILLQGESEQLISTYPQAQAEEMYLKTLAGTLAALDETSTPPIGPHKTNVLFHHVDKNIPANLCSTGEQKSLLLAIVLAFAELMKEYGTGVPVLLLDEAVAHLDTTRRTHLFEEIKDINVQTWLTGTEMLSFKEAQTMARFFHVLPGKAEEVEVKRGFL
ncbi:MAG: DNA replication/repair protein RecF [Alphaproteobacteria bacterium]|nr:DNA replication/repair protein RecF [Alphaproteobacteria bacterium]OJV47632.1 MAG: hypothetical protein BGO28_07330 [Alphaproteobacteria bacterium 43-37]